MGRICVRVDMGTLARRLSGLYGRPYTRADVHLWLKEEGFRFDGGGWHCDGDPRDRLRPDEVVEVIQEVTEGGITFVEHDRRDARSA